MKDADAQQIIRMIESTWTFTLDPEGRAVWRDGLAQHDAEIATRAVARLSTRLQYKPRLADIIAMITHLEKDRAAAEVRRTGLPEPKFESPEWVHVWRWARNRKEPAPERRSFPQQERWGDPLNMMTMDEYEELRKAWVKAGSPRARDPLSILKPAA